MAFRQGRRVASWKTKAKSRASRAASGERPNTLIPPLVDRDQIGDGPEQGRLAASRGSKHGDEAAGRHVEAHPVEGGDAAGLALEPDRQVTHRDGDGHHPGYPICFRKDSVAARISSVITSSTPGTAPLNCSRAA